MDSNSDKLTRATSDTSLTSTDDEFVYLNKPKTKEVGTMTVEIDSIPKMEESKVDKDEKSVDKVVNMGTNTTSAGGSNQQQDYTSSNNNNDIIGFYFFGKLMPIMIISFLFLFLIGSWCRPLFSNNIEFYEILHSIVSFAKVIKIYIESIYIIFAICFMIIMLVSAFILIFVVFIKSLNLSSLIILLETNLLSLVLPYFSFYILFSVTFIFCFH